MPTEAATRLLVLHGLRLKGFADAGVLARRTGAPVGLVEAALADAERDGLVAHRSGQVAGWSLTSQGRSEVHKALADELDASGARAAVEGAYGRFLELNQPLLAACTRWQLREVDGREVVNDHRDAVHDRTVVGELRAIDAAAQPIMSDLAAALPRFGWYGPRLASALEQLERGQIDWFTKPLIDSYHTVWFELHEDLLATLGLERSKESER
jgi:hypothetical protein